MLRQERFNQPSPTTAYAISAAGESKALDVSELTNALKPDTEPVNPSGTTRSASVRPRENLSENLSLTRLIPLISYELRYV